jgi:DNA (cytosine-5)-methyltransferase 1
MNVLSLFTGIGGLDLGLQRAGMTIVGQVEIDPWCRSILQKHWPEVPRHDDVRTAAEWWDGLVADTESQRQRPPRTGRPAGDGTHRQSLTPPPLAGDSPGRPAVDLVCGGFPCQPVSLAGKGLAQADSRWLWPAFADVIRQLRPAYVLVENVPGLLGRGMGDVLGDLAVLGYDAEWDCIPAAFVGAPHIRNRVWIVAYPAGIGCVGTDDDQREHPAPGRAGRPDPIDLRVTGQAGSEPRILADTGSPPWRIWAGRRQQQPRGGRISRHSDWWATEPGVGRVAHGIPHRVDRLRGLGNAVVPQVAEHIGRLIMAGAA